MANSGVDALGCGTRSSPCRSIHVGLEMARDGDTVLVGPELYGHLNSDGDFTGPGEENTAGQCNDCMILVAKRVSVVSRDGAAATLVSGVGLPAGFGVVRLGAAQVAFGRKDLGFTVLGESATDGVTALGAQDSVAGNVVLCSRLGIDASGAESLVADNRLLGNLVGVYLTGAGSRAERNAALGNGADGFWLVGPDEVLEKNVSVGNLFGATLEGPRALALRNVIAGNLWWGVGAQDASQRIEGSSLFGNGTDPASPAANCGVNASAAGVSATRNYWGSPGGPGSDPADAICGTQAGATLIEPVAKRETAGRLRPIR